ncbi:MAG: Mur ligase family protein, partial [Acidobacteriota bacterium]
MAYTYARAIRFLSDLESHGIKLGLENIRVILAKLGDPHRATPSILVGGTNGKGSVAATLDAILRATGRSVGLYTSPHLVDCRERIRVGGKAISQSGFASAAQCVAEATARARDGHALSRMPTYFEAMTAMAFEHFRRQKVDVAVVEVGMGGRFDATNVLTPLCSIITNVSLDHTQYLGKTVREIATEKAGIIKPKVPALTFARERALSVLRGRARQLG